MVQPIMFGMINRADAATLSGGSYQPGLPRTNLQESNLAFPARTVDALTTSTRVDIDYGNSDTVCRVFWINGHNLSTAATYRLTGSNVSASGTEGYDSGTVDAWPAIYSLFDLDFEELNWWTGQPTEEEAALYGLPIFVDLGANYLLQYWRLQITDTGNADGYVELTRLWMGPVWQPRHQYTPGAGLGWEPRDRAVESRGGQRYAERLTPRRVFSIKLEGLNDMEAFGRALDMQRVVGSEGEVLVVPEPDDTANWHRRCMLARVRRADPIVAAMYGNQEATFTFEGRL